MFINNTLKAISEYGKKYLLGGPSSEDGFQDQQPRLMELEGLRLILGGGLLMRKFWAEEDKSEALEPLLDQGELDAVSEETEAVISGKDPLLSDEEEQLLLSGGTGSAVSNRDVQVQVDTEHLISNRDVQVQVETGPVSNTDVTVQTDGHTEIEDLRRKNENLAEELAIKQAVIQAHENQIDDYYQSILELKAELKMAREKNYVHNQMESALVKDKEALKQEVEDKVTLDEENTKKIVQLTEELEKAKKEIEAHDELKSILLAKNDLKKSNEERSFLYEELALEKIKLEKELMQARANDQKRVLELQGEISKALLQNHKLKEAVFTITKKNEAKDVISSLKKELQKRDLEHVIKEEGMGDVETCENAADDDNKVVVVKEKKQEEDGPPRKLLIKKPKKKKPKRDKVSYSWAPLGSMVPVLETGENKVHNERTQEENIQNN
ncbi:myosin heavy chain, clone 203-like [Palaemon carinicauda]|uniref:myosin heavy chain, clone 203-like n=1 Tax=Palaemon carinicauda TaxID=392227 RepID=UPI0035B57CA4